MQDDYEIVILGAGLAGLACGIKFAEKNIPALIIEKEDSVGGLSRSIRRDGFIFDLGGHRFLPKDKEIEIFSKSLFNNEALGVIDRKSQILMSNKFLMYPPEIKDILRKLGPLTCAECVLGGLYRRARHNILKDAEKSLRDWLLNRFGKKLYEIYFGPYSSKLWGKDASEISADWAAQRISVSSISVAMRHLLSKRHTQTYARNFLYPKGGIGQIAEQMAARVSVKGKIHTGHTIKKVTRCPGGFRVESQNKKGRQVFFARKLVCTIPLPDFVLMFEEDISNSVKEAAKNLSFRSIRFLNIMIDAPQITDNTWIYIPESKYIFFRIQELINWHPENCAADKTSLTLEIACEKNDKRWQMDDKELLRLCLEDLKKMGFDLRNKVIGYFSSFAEHAYPVYTMDYAEHLNKIYEYFKGQDDIILCGRQGLFRYINMDDCMKTGFLAADSFGDENKRTDLLSAVHSKEYLEKNLYWRRNEL